MTAAGIQISARDRVLAAIRFQQPGSVPTWTPNYPPIFVRRWRDFTGPSSDTEPRQYYRNDTVILIGDERFFPSQAGFIRRDGQFDISNNGWGCIVRTVSGGYFSQEIERVLKAPRDLDAIRFEPPALSSRYEGLAERTQAAHAAGKCTFTKIGGIYVRSHFLRGEPELLTDMAGDEPFCDDLFDRVTDHFESMALETLRRTQTYETGLFVYDDIAGSKGPMFSPRMFEQYFLPRYQRIIARCRKAGCQHFFFHSDGHVTPLLDLLIAAGFEGINPLEPRCNPGLVQLRKKYGRKLVFLGGLCNTQILPRNDRREIEAHIRPLLELVREGGTVLGMASVPAEMPPEAYDYAMRLMDGVSG